MRVLVVGPDYQNTRGGIASVIKGMHDNSWLTKASNMDFFSSYREGNLLMKTVYAAWRIAVFRFVFRSYDLIHIHMSKKGSAERKIRYAKIAKASGKKVVIHVHAGSFMEYYAGLSEKKKARLKKCLQDADCVFALSGQWKRELEHTFELTNCEVLCNGVLIQDYPAPEEQKAISERKIDMLFLGRLGLQKGSDLLLSVLGRIKREHKDFLCVMAGDGPADEYKEKAKKENLEEQVKIPGWADKELKKKLLQESKIMILPSYYEGLPMSILEAMASGAAVITTPVGGIPEAVRDGQNGILVAPGDEQGLYRAVKALLENPEKVAKMGCAGRKLAEEQYDLEKIHRQLYRKYCEILGVNG